MIQQAAKDGRLVIGHTIYAFRDGGIERGLLNLINHGDQNFFRHVIVCLTEAGEFAELLRAPDCEIVELRKRQGNDWCLPWRIAQVARRQRLDVLHARGWPTMVETAVGARLARVRATVYSFHGKTFEDLQGISRRRRWVQKAVIRAYQRVFTLNRCMGAELAAECSLGENLIEIIANGVDADKFCPRTDKDELRRLFDLPADRIILGNVARLDPVKNHKVVLRALARVADRDLRPYFLLVGEGHHRTALEPLVQQLGLAADVRFFGYSDRIPELLNCLDVYVQSSFYEGFSNTVLEAMACGLPVLATDVGGTKDVLSEGMAGVFFQPQDDEELTTLIVRLSKDDRLRRTLGELGRRRVLDNFTVQTMARNYENVYWQLARSGNHPVEGRNAVL
jgi:sugar transferase (PEP-CTERM/EpsH1 system associated)